LTRIKPTASRGWNFPEGTVLVKTFSLGGKRIETRLLTKQIGQWVGYSYRWDPAGRDATLVPSTGADQQYAVRDAAAPGGTRSQTWHFPSRTECMVCHSRAANFVLGLSTEQMNKVHDYPRGRADQLRTLEHLGVFKVNIKQHLDQARLSWSHGDPKAGKPVEVLARTSAALAAATLEPISDPQSGGRKALFTTLLPRPSERSARLVDPYDKRAPLEARARSYLHANCAVCHVPAGGGNAQIDLEFTTKLADMKLINEPALHRLPGLTPDKLIEPGQPERSLLYLRVSKRGAGQMPPLATSQVDEAGTRLLRSWIQEMKKGDK
jgi:mono/diheme cytochrome c family protein